MPVTLSIKNVPDQLAEKLRGRAARRHRSLQGELLAILEETVSPRRASPRDLLKLLKESGLRTPAEAAKMIRADRDAR
jgi:antitoxin FitA